GLTDHGDKLSPATRCRIESVGESFHLALATNEAREPARGDGLEARASRSRSEKLIYHHGLVQAFDGHRPERDDADVALDEPKRFGSHQDVPGWRELFHPGGQMRCEADRRVL